MNNKDYIDHFKIFDEIDSMVVPKDPHKPSINIPKNNKQTFGIGTKESKQTNLNQLNQDVMKALKNKQKYMNSPTTDKNKNLNSAEYTPNIIDIDRKKPVHLNQYINYVQDGKISVEDQKNQSNIEKAKEYVNKSKLGAALKIRPSSGNSRLASGNPNANSKTNLNKSQSKKIFSYGHPSSTSGIFNNNDKKANTSTKTNSRFEQLYQDNKRTQDKIEKKRVDYQKSISTNMVPKINSNSKNINRDSANFEERLYPYHKMNGYSQVINNNISNSNINIFVNLDQEESLFNKYYRKNPAKNYDNFNYQPKISDKSTRIAEKLGSSFERLIKKKKRAPSADRSYKSDYGIQLSRSSNVSRQSGKSGRSTSSSRYIDTNLYQRGLELKKEREQLYINNKEETIKKKVGECTFKPELYKKSNNNDRTTSSIDFYQRQMLSIKEKQELIIMKKDLQEKKEMEHCSFKPNINDLGLTDDEELIKKHSDEISEYISKKKKTFDKKKEDQEYKQKKFYQNPQNLSKPTKVNEFTFNTAKINYRRNLNRSIDYDARKYNDRLMVNRGGFGLNSFFDKKDYGTVSSSKLHNEEYYSKQSNNQGNYQ